MFLWTTFWPKVSTHDQPLFECVSLKDKEVLRVEMCGNVLGLYVGKRRTAWGGGGLCVDMSVGMSNFLYFCCNCSCFCVILIDVGMEEADPPATPIAQPFKVGDLVHVFEGACKGLDLNVVVSGCASVSCLVIPGVVWLGFLFPFCIMFCAVLSFIVFLPSPFVCP